MPRLKLMPFNEIWLVKSFMLYFDTYKTNSMRSKIYTLLLILSLLLVAQSQNQRRGRKTDETPSNHGILSNIINIVLPGNPNTPIL